MLDYPRNVPARLQPAGKPNTDREKKEDTGRQNASQPRQAGFLTLSVGRSQFADPVKT